MVPLHVEGQGLLVRIGGPKLVSMRRLGVWPKLLLLGAPLLVAAALVWLFVLRPDDGESVGLATKAPAEPAASEEPATEAPPRPAFPVPLDSFADTLGLETVPRLIKDGKGDCKPVQRQQPRFCPPQVDIERMYAFTAAVDEARAKQLYDSFPCGAGPKGRLTLCSSQMPSDVERLVIVAVELKKGLPDKPGKAVLEVALQFDGDGKALNNKRASVPDDYTQGSDDSARVAQIIAAKNRWTVEGPRRLPRTRIVFMKRWVLFFVPGLAFELEAPRLRVSTLALTPDFLKTGFDALPGPPGKGWKKMLTPEVIATSPVEPSA